MKDERILAVRTRSLEDYICYNGIKVSPIVNNDFLNIIKSQGEFVNRSEAENNQQLKQVIPYAFIICGNNIFLTKRKTAQSEVRLHNKYSLGIGGHINEFDINSIDDIVYTGMLRELNEEVFIDTDNIIDIKGVALLSDDNTDVGKVHMGVVFKIVLDSQRCTVRETEKMMGIWVALSELSSFYNQMETWSQIVIDYIM